MLTSEINKVLRYEKNFLGTYPCDRIPKTNSRPLGVIINTDKSTEKGSHWVAIFTPESNIGEYFDSFGIPPMQSDIINYLNETCFRWSYNPFKLQSDTSSTCGKFCIFFIQKRLKGLTFDDVLSLLTEKTKENDILVKAYTKA